MGPYLHYESHRISRLHAQIVRRPTSEGVDHEKPGRPELRDKVVDEEVPGDVQGAGEPELLLRSGSQDCGEEFCVIRHGERCGPGSKEAISGAPIAYPLK